MADIRLQLSGGAANETPANSLGGVISTHVNGSITTTNTNNNNLWDNITKAENFAGTTDYRCVYIKNASATPGDLFANGVIYISGTSQAVFQIGLDPAGVNATATTIANETTAPTGISFGNHPQGSPLTIPTLNEGDYIGLWIKRTASNITGSGTIPDALNLTIVGTE